MVDLVAPAFWHCPDQHDTLGPEVGDLCRMANFAPDPEQQMLLDGSFGIDARGRLTAFEVALVAPRQNIKTGFLKQQALGKAFLLKRPLIVWSAHEFNTTKEAFRDLVTLIESTPELDRRVHKIMRGNGDESIELHGGRTRIVFRARTKSGGRGLSGDDVDLDEALYLQPDHVGSLLPVLSTRKNPQVTYAGSAGVGTSAVWRGIRDRGRRGLSPRMLYAEWTIERLDVDGKVLVPPCGREDCTHEVGSPACILDDRDLIGSVNTQAGRRIGWDYLEDERQALPPLEYLRERGGVWDDPASSDDPPAIDSAAWAGLANAAAVKPGRVWLYVHCSPDGARTTIAAAGAGTDGRTLVLTWTRPGRGWVVKKLRKMLDKGNVAGVALNPRTQAGAVAEKLDAAGIEYVKASSTEAGQATVGMVKAVLDGEVEHVGQPELDEAVREARTRRFDEGERFDQRDPAGPDISPLIAAAGARHRWAVEGDYDIDDSFL